MAEKDEKKPDEIPSQGRRVEPVETKTEGKEAKPAPKDHLVVTNHTVCLR